MKLTYANQLRHPEWQRKRLEVLSAADFCCQCCGTKDDTLHVHHKRYVKGRMAWEYEISELESLCEACHAEAHAAKNLIDEVVASITTSQLTGAAVLLAARYAPALTNQDLVDMVDQDPYNDAIGRAAKACNALSIFDIERLRETAEVWAKAYTPGPFGI